jgi:type II restriction enzyme
MLTGNKGEWSEIYTLLKLIADGRIQKGDHNLIPLPNESYRIIGIERSEASTGPTTYKINDGSVEISNATDCVSLERSIFKAESDRLLDEIRNLPGVAEIPDTELFMKQILAFSLKARSQDKADIRVEIHDHRTSIAHTRGFSIKSQLGSPSTLLNASRQTVFRYKLTGMTQNQCDEINSIDTKGALICRVQAISNLDNVEVAYLGSTSESFSYNLRHTDDAVPDMVSSLLWNFYLQHESKLDQLLSYISLENIRGYKPEDAEKLYAAKLKRLLANAALGMQPAQQWNGNYDANGGYLVVLRTGEIISYHIFDKNEFEAYLFHNTKLETPSTSRYNIGKVFEEQGNYYIDLGLQIRFCI